MAPEIFKKQPYGMKADIYSYGIVLWELIALARPFPDLRSWEVPPAVCGGIRPPIPDDVPPILRQLIERFLPHSLQLLAQRTFHASRCNHAHSGASQDCRQVWCHVTLETQ
jgi:serine/threonine protein kinase